MRRLAIEVHPSPALTARLALERALEDGWQIETALSRALLGARMRERRGLEVLTGCLEWLERQGHAVILRTPATRRAPVYEQGVRLELDMTALTRGLAAEGDTMDGPWHVTAFAVTSLLRTVCERSLLTATTLRADRRAIAAADALRFLEAILRPEAKRASRSAGGKDARGTRQRGRDEARTGKKRGEREARARGSAVKADEARARASAVKADGARARASAANADEERARASAVKARVRASVAKAGEARARASVAKAGEARARASVAKADEARARASVAKADEARARASATEARSARGAKETRGSASRPRRETRSAGFGGLPDDAQPEERPRHDASPMGPRGISVDAELFLEHAGIDTWPCSLEALNKGRRRALASLHPDRRGESATALFQRAVRGYTELVRQLDGRDGGAVPARAAATEPRSTADASAGRAARGSSTAATAVRAASRAGQGEWPAARHG